MEPEEVLEQEVVQEKEPLAEVKENDENINVEEPEVNVSDESVEEEPVGEETPAEPAQEEEPVEEVVAEPAPEPVKWNISTGGNWEPLENYLTEQLEVGKTFHIKVQGKCKFMIAKDKPTAGIATNEITFTKQNDVTIWIKTGV